MPQRLMHCDVAFVSRPFTAALLIGFCGIHTEGRISSERGSLCFTPHLSEVKGLEKLSHRLKNEAANFQSWRLQLVARCMPPRLCCFQSEDF